MDIKIIYEDDYMLVINKPRGIIVNRAESVKVNTIQDWAEKKYQISNIKYQKEKNPKDTSDGGRLIPIAIGRSHDSSEVERSEEAFYQRAGIVHRLDKETSGLLIIAKNADIFSKLQLQFRERTIEKKYLALVHGKVVPPQGEIKASVGRLPWNRERFGVLAGGRDATTSYNVITYYNFDDEIYTLLEVSPHTGRTHQIRIHLKYIGHTIVGDNFYAGRKTYRYDFKFCPYLFLHARYLKMLHPVTANILEISCDLPSELEEVLRKMQKITK